MTSPPALDGIGKPQRRFTPGVIGAAIFTAGYLLVAATTAVMIGNAEFLFYILIMVLLIAAVLGVHARVGLGTGLLWTLTIWGALHMAGGLVPVPETWPIAGEFRVLYNWWIISNPDPTAGAPGGWLKYDQITHAYGFGIATWLCWQALRAAMAGQGANPVRPTPGLMVLVAAAGCGLGALNEIIEFIATLAAETNVGGYLNTALDLVFNAIGAVIAALLIYLFQRRRPSMPA